MASEKMEYDLVHQARKYFVKSIKEYQYKFGMDILYDMCKKSPNHANVGNNISKLWLIGRSHSAALERRSNPDDYENPYEKTARTLAKNDKLDLLIKTINSCGTDDVFDYSKENCKNIYAVVCYLCKVFSEKTGNNKISLASKYLHFHANVIPIYDSISVKALRMLIKSSDIDEDLNWLTEATKCHAYALHLARFVTALRQLRKSNILKETEKIEFSDAKKLDIFLLNWWT